MTAFILLCLLLLLSLVCNEALQIYNDMKEYAADIKEETITNSIFYKEHNYTLIPRGRIFLESDTFFVNVGSWINGEVNGQKCIDKEKLRELIVDEFNLPEDFKFRIDHHWDIGHGWPEEKF